MNSPDKPAPDPSRNTAAEHVAEAHELLKTLRGQLEQHPELDEAIVKLELALSVLTLQTGGLI